MVFEEAALPVVTVIGARSARSTTLAAALEIRFTSTLGTKRALAERNRQVSFPVSPPRPALTQKSAEFSNFTALSFPDTAVRRPQRRSEPRHQPAVRSAAQPPRGAQ